MSTENRTTILKEEYITLTEEGVRELMKKYVSADIYNDFIVTNAVAIKTIARGGTSAVLTFNNNKTKQEYKARVQGVKRVGTKYGHYYAFNCLYANKELGIANLLVIKGESAHLTDEQITELKTRGRLDELVEFKSEAGSTKRFVGVDKELNRLSFINAQFVKISEKIFDVTLTKEQTQSLKEGKALIIPFPTKDDKTKMIDKEVFYNPVLNRIEVRTPGSPGSQPSQERSKSLNLDQFVVSR